MLEPLAGSAQKACREKHEDDPKGDPPVSMGFQVEPVDMMQSSNQKRWAWIVAVLLGCLSTVSAEEEPTAPSVMTWRQAPAPAAAPAPTALDKELTTVPGDPVLPPPPPRPDATLIHHEPLAESPHPRKVSVMPKGKPETLINLAPEMLPPPLTPKGEATSDTEASASDSNAGKLMERPLTDEDDPNQPKVDPSFFEMYEGEHKYPDLLGIRPGGESQELYELDPPLGFTGRSGVARTVAPNAHFVPIEDRWRLGFPKWDRYDRGHALPDDYPFELGKWYDPYQQNVLKGDYPIIGQHIFLNILAQSLTLVDGRQTPLPTTPFESTQNPFQEEFFGSPNQLFVSQFLRLSFDLFHGDAAFKPMDWRVKITPVLNANDLNVDELALTNPNVLRGVQRERTFLALEEYFVEAKLADLSPDYDFVSVRAGSQFFNSDFRGFLFFDTNRAVRIFGNRLGNREQFNLAFFRQAEKETNSGLNTMRDRAQNILIANYFRQDVIWPGFQIQLSVHYNNDHPTRKFDTNSFRARPDNAGVAQPHSLDVVYFGFATDGHIDRYNITSQLYYALGRDTLNPIATRAQDIRAAMAAVELSYDRDWARFRTSFFWSSGDHNPNNEVATGFDTIFDNPNFAGGGFSYWQRQGIGLFGVNLTNRESLIPNLRASKIQGQSNFVNPGLLLFNLGIDLDITPRLKLIHNVNFLWFEATEVLETFLFAGDLDNRIGTDISLGLEYRPLASNNIQFLIGVSALVPGSGFKALYNKLDDNVDTLYAAFMQTILQY